MGVRGLATKRGLGGRLPSSHPPGRPSHCARCRRTRSLGLLACPAAHGLRGHRQRPCPVATGRLDAPRDIARPPRPRRTGNRTRRTRRRLAESPARSWADAATVPRQAGALRRRLPPRALAGQGVWASVEVSILVLGPPRLGKGLHVVINAILDAPAAVITTATRPDPTTSQPPSPLARSADRSLSSTLNGLPRVYRPAFAGHPCAAAKTHSPR